VGEILCLIIRQMHHRFTKRMKQAATLHMKTVDHAVAVVNLSGL